jgi:hypothetical protein
MWGKRSKWIWGMMTGETPYGLKQRYNIKNGRNFLSSEAVAKLQFSTACLTGEVFWKPLGGQNTGLLQN